MINIWIINLITLGMAATSLSQDSHGSSSSGSSPILYQTHMTNVSSQLNWAVAEGAHLPPHMDLMVPSPDKHNKLFAGVQSVDEWLHNLDPNNITHSYAPRHPAHATPYYDMEFLREPFSSGQVFHSTSMCFSYSR